MSALYGRMGPNTRGNWTTVASHHEITAQVETWEGIVKVDLDREGNYGITVMDKHGNNRRVLVNGNINERTAYAVLTVSRDGLDEGKVIHLDNAG
jgi:hypothetical protein